MSKNDPPRTDPLSKPPPEKVEARGESPQDAALEELTDVDGALGRREQRELTEEGDRQIEKLRSELEEAKDRALRRQAELENYQKRVARQMEEERRYANLPLIRDLLPVWDNVGRAIEAAETTHQTASLLEGFKMVAGQLESVLERHHCSKIEALGEPFDPNFHEAIFQQPSNEHPANTVLQVTQTGFRLHDRVVRPSQVIVSAAMPGTETNPEDETAPQGTEKRAEESEDTAG